MLAQQNEQRREAMRALVRPEAALAGKQLFTGRGEVRTGVCCHRVEGVGGCWSRVGAAFQCTDRDLPYTFGCRWAVRACEMFPEERMQIL